MSAKFTPIRSFAMKLLQTKKSITPGFLACEWSVFKHGRYPKSASRDSFGLTSSCYKTLRFLRDEGYVSTKDGHEFTLIEK